MTEFTNPNEPQDWDPTSVPDAHDVATEWVNASKSFKGNVPASADLATMITGIGQDFTMQGAPELEIDLLDQDWSLLDSGFFDPVENGTLDRIDINYPLGSKYHWRIFQFSPQSDYTVKSYWIPRVVGDLMTLNAKHNPLSANRATRTRAQFLQTAVGKVPYANFYSAQLATVQQVTALSIPTDTGGTLKSALNAGKTVGVSTAAMNDNGLTVKGQPMGDRQRAQVNILLKAAAKYGAGQVATEALLLAAIWESNLEIYATNGTYWGVLSGKIGVWAQTDTSGMATAFLLGNSQKGFQGGGAIALSATVKDPLTIALKVEGTYPQNQYAGESGWPGEAKALAEVDAIIQAGGGATGVGGVSGQPVEAVQQYNFQIGTSTDPAEDYWTGINRVAQEVNWEIVIDGDDVYYDSDVTLCRAEIAAVVDRRAESVASWSYDWNRTQLPTNFQLILQNEPFDFKPADVFQLTNFGPASEGSSIGLPGRWLVGEIQRTPGDIVSTFTLIQPTQPLREPAPTLGTTIKQNPAAITLTGKGVNPFVLATGLVPERVDDGKDYSMRPGSPILAPFDSMYLGVLVPNWYAGQPYVGFQIVGGTYNGWCYYFAEQISPATFGPRQIVKAGTQIATYAQSGTGIECGLANPKNPAQTLAQGNGHGGEVPSPEGLRWEAILKALGAPV